MNDIHKFFIVFDKTTSHLNAINHSDAVEKQCIVQPPTSGDHTTGN